MKKLLMIIPLVFLLCFTVGCQKAEEVAEEPAMDIAVEEAAIRETMEKSINGLSNHDIKAHLSTLSENYETWSGKGDLKTREQYFIKLWEWQKSVKYNVVEELGISFIYPDCALFKARCESTGEIEKDGTPIPKNEWQGVWILVKKERNWIIAAWYTRPIEK